MSAKLLQVDVPPTLLERGFWIYAWKIVGPCGDLLTYIGMTGDVTGVAQSPFVRAGAHLGFNKNSNALRRLLGDEAPERSRQLTFLAYGPLLEYAKGHPNFQVNRKKVGALERKLWDEAQKAGNKMLNERPRFAGDFDPALWKEVRSAFASHLGLSH